MPSYVSNLTKLQKKYEQDGKNWHRPTQGREKIYRQKEGDSSLFWAPKLREERGRAAWEEEEREREKREKRTLDAHTSREKERKRERTEKRVSSDSASLAPRGGKLRIIYLLNNNNNTFFSGEKKRRRVYVRDTNIRCFVHQ